MPSELDTDNELELDIEEGESDDDTQNTEGEGESVDVNLGESKPELTPAEKNALAQEEKWLAKITSGQSSLEELASNNLKWLVPRIEKRLGALEKAPDIDEIVERKLNEKAEEQRFKELQQSLPKISAQKASELKEHYASLVNNGLKRTAALETAIKLVGITPEGSKEARRKAMALPPVGQPKPKEDNSPASLLKKGDMAAYKNWLKEQDKQSNRFAQED